MKALKSSLKVIELLSNKLYYRNNAKPKWTPRKYIPEPPTPRPSQNTVLPQELVETIISYLIHDIPTLLACSMTCFSWYIAALPHLHHSLTANDNAIPWEDGKYQWPGPLRKSYELGLLPLVRRFRIRHDFSVFAPEQLDRSTLRYFSALTNVQDLGIDDLQISSFMPRIRQSFGHFSPTLRSLALRKPIGSCRQILYFIGLFPNLQDLKLCYLTEERESTADADLVPLSVPPLQGQLTLVGFTKGKLMKEMIALFGGLHFRHMNIFDVWCVRLLLGACAETLEVLQLYATDLFEDDQAVRWHFDLSQNKCLRTLETTAESMVAPDASPSFLSIVLSTVTSPLFLDVVVVYWEGNVDRMVYYWLKPVVVVHLLPEDIADNALYHRRRFEQFREMYRTREFRLVLRVDVLDCIVEDVIRSLECVVETEKVKGGLDYFPCEPVIISEVQSPRTGLGDNHVGWPGSGRWGIRASAL